MNPSLQKLFDEMETQREKTMDSVRHLTEEQLNKQIRVGKWSVSQILSHVITAERLSLLYVQKKMQGINEAADSGLREEIKMVLLKISQRMPGIKFKAPQRIFENTAFYRDFDSMQREWIIVRNELKSTLEKFQDHHISRKVYKHPIAGYLNVRQCLVFLREHLIHHTPQIKRLLIKK
jgi:hypothetical protein